MNITKLFFAVGVLFSFNRAFCQTNKIDIGFEGGIGVAYITGTEAIEEFNDATIGFGAGFFAQFNFKKVLSIRTGIGAENKGFTSPMVLADQYGNQTQIINLRTGLNYLTVPLLLRATFGKSFQFFLNGGPYLGYLIKQPTSGILGMTFNNFPPYRKFDFGVSTGLGFSIPIKTKAAISFEIRQNFGLYNINSTLFYSDYETINTNSTLALLSFSRKLGFRN